jgi:hypothetical protein
MKLPLNKIADYQKKLNEHPLLNDNIIKNIDHFHIFMENHVFAVWDFMSLIKSLQHHICPSTTCWIPTKHIRSEATRLINEIVLAEESDVDMYNNGYICHHDLYCQAMLELGCDATQMEEWLIQVENHGFYEALETASVPASARKFMSKTFDFINSGEPHIIAAAFCFGRENIIPDMFKRLAEELQLTKIECPRFNYYLERHIEVDGGEHGPASIRIIENLCEGDPVKLFEAEQTAIKAIKARIEFWDDIMYLILNKTQDLRHG